MATQRREHDILQILELGICEPRAISYCGVGCGAVGNKARGVFAVFQLSFYPDSANVARTRRNAIKFAEAKNTEGEVLGQVARLTVEAAELQRFAQEYMVKAAQEKQNVRCKPNTSGRGVQLLCAYGRPM